MPKGPLGYNRLTELGPFVSKTAIEKLQDGERVEKEELVEDCINIWGKNFARGILPQNASEEEVEEVARKNCRDNIENAFEGS